MKNTFIFTGAMMAQKLLAFLYFLYLSSSAAPGVLGSYVWALSLTTLFSIGTDLGLSTAFTREASRRIGEGNALLRNVIGMKMPITALTVILLFATALITGRSSETILLLSGAAAVMSADALTLVFYGALRARQNINYESVGIIIFQSITFALGAALWEATGKITLVMLALVAASFVNLVYSASMLKFRLGYRIMPSWNRETVKMFVRLAPAFALTGVFVKVYNVADSVLLGFLAGEHAVGIYSVPAKVVTALQSLIPGAFAASLFPSMSNYYVTSRERLATVFRKSFGYRALLAAPISAGLATTSPVILSTLWPQYQEAEMAFALMALGLPFVFLAFATGALLNASDREKTSTAHRGIITAINVVLNLALIPLVGVTGAAISFLAVNIILLALDLRAAGRVVPWEASLTKLVAKALISSVLMGAVVVRARGEMPLPILVGLGVAVYALAIVLLRAVSLREVKVFIGMLRKPQPPSGAQEVL